MEPKVIGTNRLVVGMEIPCNHISVALKDGEKHFKLQRGFMRQQKIFADLGHVAPFAFAALLLGNIAIAFGPMLVRFADTGPVATGFWRLALAVPVLALMAKRSGFAVRAMEPKLIAYTVIAGLFFAFDIIAWHIGIFRTKLGNSTLFANGASLLLVIYGIWLARALPAKMQMIAIVLAFAGAALLLGQSLELSPRNLSGDMLCILAGTFYTFYLLLMITVREKTDSFGALTLASAVAAAALLPVAYFLGETVMPVSWWPLLALAFSSQIFGQGCLTYALPHFSPLVIGLALLIQPALSAAAGWFAFGEILSRYDMIGGMMVMAALVLVRASDRKV
jgi:drug/metabolite transporter (DMT)-like permease